MPEPTIQYATTADGVRIACSITGGGDPVVYVPPAPFSHLREELAIPEHRAFFDALAARYALVRYDGRGSGLSDRSAVYESLDTYVLDLEAVVNHLGLQRFALVGFWHGALTSFAYTARHQPRVSRIVAFAAAAAGAAYMEDPQFQVLMTLIDQDWELFTETLAHAWVGWVEGPPAHGFATMVRASVTPDALRGHLAALQALDGTALLPRVPAPVLLLHRPAAARLRLEWASALAAALPDARVMMLSGESLSPFLDAGDLTAATLGFLKGDAAIAPAAPAPPAALTLREADVLRLLARGRTNKEIAQELTISVSTAERHVANIYRKIGARGRAEATAYAITNGVR